MSTNTSTLSAEIRRQFGAESTTRFLRSLPAFHVEKSMPERLRDLLAKLEQAEGSGTRSRRSGGH